MPELDAERIDVALIGRQLATVIGLDAVARELERSQGRAVALRGRGLDVGGGHFQSDLIEVEPVEPARQVDERAVAARHNVGDDRPHGLLDVFRALALGSEESAETLGKVRRARVEADRHDRSMARRKSHVKAAVSKHGGADRPESSG